VLVTKGTMHGTVFAVAMIAMICTTLIVLKRFGKRPDERSRRAGIFLAAVTLLVLACVTYGHLCDRGGARGAVAYGTVFAGVVRATVDRKAVRRLLWTGWFALTFWGSLLCHLDGYVGNPACAKRYAEKPAKMLASVQDRLRREAENRKGMSLREGWMDDSWRASTGEEFTRTTCLSGVYGHYWHTWFTGVLSFDVYRCGVWCPGGPIEECSESVEIRPGG
jgi:hypothetical protein